MEKRFALPSLRLPRWLVLAVLIVVPGTVVLLPLFAWWWRQRTATA